MERCGQHNKKLWDSDSVSPKKKITITVACAHPQDKLNLLLALWSQGLVHFDWVIHCMGGPMNLLRTKWTGENWEWILGFVFLPEIHKIFIIAKISISPMTRRTETHTVSGHYGTLQGVVLLFKPIFIVVLLLNMIRKKHIWISNKWFLLLKSWSKIHEPVYCYIFLTLNIEIVLYCPHYHYHCQRFKF